MVYTMKKRCIAGTLALFMLLFSSCSAAESENDTAESAPVDSASEETAAPEETRPPLNLPDMDFNGAAFRTSYFCGSEESETGMLQPTETTGEAVNDAIYNRNTMLMDKYNFVFETTPIVSDYGKHTKNISAMILANEDAYEMIYGHVVGTCNNAVAGDYRNLYDIPYLQMQAEWWPAQSVDDMTVYGRMYTITSSATYDQLANAKVVYFNKDLAEQYHLPDLYEITRNGNWTLDALIEQSSGIYQDVNGDGVHDPDDLYGYTTIAVQNGFFVSTNTPVLAKTEDGGREISVMNERTVNLIEKLYSWYYESGAVHLTVTSDTDPHFYTWNFAAGKAAFSFGKLKQASQNYRESDITYGILPQPKYDTAQEMYSTFACPNLFSIPLTCQNTDLAGFVLEAMTYYGYYDIVPVYYETTLQGKIADAPEDVEMLEIINNTLTVSFAYCYDNWEGFAHFLSAIFNEKTGDKDVASFFQKREKSAEKRLQTCLDAFRTE